MADTSHQRLFLALWPEAAHLNEIAAHASLWNWPDSAVRYAPQDWHVTLRFLGSVPSLGLPALRTALNVPFAPFELCLDQPQCWPRGLAVWCSKEIPQGLVTLHQRLSAALDPMGWPPDPRPYRPHLTLARHATQASPPTRSDPMRWRVNRYALVESTGDPSQRYRILHTYWASGIHP